MNLHGKSFIGDRLSAGSGEGVRPVSPLDSTTLEPGFFQAEARDVEEAMQLAAAAFESYRETTGVERASFLERIAEEIIALGDDLITRASQESGLPGARIVGERARTVGQLKMFAEVAREGSWVDARIDTAIPDRQPLPKPDLRRMLSPIGPVVVFGSSNFPLAFSVAGGDTASALATGNPVVVKAHSGHPGTSELVATAIRKAATALNLHPGVFSLLHGSGKVIGMALVKHPATRAVGFTGSRAAGRALFDAAAARPEPIPVFAEMSSLNPLFILPGALRDRAGQIAEGLKGSITLGVGQFCTKPGLVFGLKGTEFDAFQRTLGDLISKTPPATMLHRGICDSYHKGLSLVANSKAAEELGRSGDQPDSKRTHGEPVVMRTEAARFRRSPELAEEVFGPFALVVAAETMEELEETALSLEGQLTATLHGTAEEIGKARRLIQILELKAGRLIVNGFPTGVEVCPSMNHGGPYPATSDSRFTSVGTAALYRFVRPISYQNFPQAALPDALKDGNPLKIRRMKNGLPET